MEKRKINYGFIIFIVILVILFLPIIVDYYKSRKITILTDSELTEKITTATENFIVYVGDVDNKTAKGLRKVRDKSTTTYSYEYTVYSISDSDKVDELLGDNTKVAFIIEGDIQKVYTEYNFDIVSDYADLYFVGNITDENKSYKVADSYSAYKKLVKSDEITMAVFGRNSCSYCNLFKVVYNAVAEKYGVDIYYFDSDNYDSTDYKKIINMDLTVPAQCSSAGEEFQLSDGFSTPLTIFTKNGKVIDCISGYVKRSKLVEKLTTLEMISE